MANSQTHEIGLRGNGLENFDLFYKKQRHENRFLRVRFGSLQLNYQEDSRSIDSQIGLGAAVGFERRHRLDERLQFFHGFEPQISLDFARSSITSPNAARHLHTDRVGLFLGYVVGFKFSLTPDIYLAAETIPSVGGLVQRVRGDSGTPDNRVRLDLRAGVNSGATAISIMYRFGK